MSIRAQAAADMRSNMLNLGDTVILTNPAGTASYTLKGHVWRTDLAVDAQTQAKYLEPKTCVSIPIADLPAGALTEAWRVSVTDVTGATVAGNVQSPAYDRTIGFVSFEIEAVN